MVPPYKSGLVREKKKVRISNWNPSNRAKECRTHSYHTTKLYSSDTLSVTSQSETDFSFVCLSWKLWCVVALLNHWRSEAVQRPNKGQRLPSQALAKGMFSVALMWYEVGLQFCVQRSVSRTVVLETLKMYAPGHVTSRHVTPHRRWLFPYDSECFYKSL